MEAQVMVDKSKSTLENEINKKLDLWEDGQGQQLDIWKDEMFMTLLTRGLLETHVHDYFDIEKAKKKSDEISLIERHIILSKSSGA